MHIDWEVLNFKLTTRIGIVIEITHVNNQYTKTTTEIALPRAFDPKSSLANTKAMDPWKLLHIKLLQLLLSGKMWAGLPGPME